MQLALVDYKMTWKETALVYLKEISSHLPGGTDENVNDIQILELDASDTVNTSRGQ
jgi:hypothetical protein